MADRYDGLNLKVYDEAKLAGYRWVRAGHDKYREKKPRPEGFESWSLNDRNSWICGFTDGCDVLWRPADGR